MHFFHTQDGYPGVQSGANNWTACHIRQHLSIFVHQVSSTDYEIRFVQDSVLIDTDNPACVANEQQLGVGAPSARHLQVRAGFVTLT